MRKKFYKAFDIIDESICGLSVYIIYNFKNYIDLD